MKLYIKIIILLLVFTNAVSQPVDIERSKVLFEIGNFKINTVEGTFHGMHGKVNFNPNDLVNSEFDVCIDASTANTENNSRDKHLRGEDFFNVKVYPEICIKVNSIEKLNGKYMADSELTMLGVTRSVDIPFVYENNTLTGTFEVKRLDYGLGKGTGTFTVSNDVEITIVCVLK